MSLPTVAEMNAAAATLADLAAVSNNPAGAQQEARQVCARFRGAYARMLADAVEIAITDATDAGVSEFIDVTGEGAELSVGDYFSPVADTNDLIDDALATAKGGAVALADVYQVSGADAVTFVGLRTEDFSTMDASLAD